MIERAVISVYDKTGIDDFARGLARFGVELISTGGTYRRLVDAGVPVTYVSDVTGFPEVLEGRVKTLHPRIHAGILARRDRGDDLEELASHKIKPIDLVAVNLYPFRETIARPGTSFDEAMENIDIGGPTLVRAAAKNNRFVLVAVNPSRYGAILERLEQGKDFDQSFREALAEEAFAHTAAYDAAIRDYFAARRSGGESGRMNAR